MSDGLKAMLRRIQHGVLNPGSDTGTLVIGSENLTAEERLAIYTDAYHARLVEALAVDFGGLCAYIGDAAFEQLVRKYASAYPSRYYSLRGLGGKLCDYLREQNPYSAHPDLYELATFEWALSHAFDAADVPGIDVAELGSIEPDEWPNLVFEFHPSVQIIELQGNAPALWSDLTTQQTPPAFCLQEQSESWLIWRQVLKVMYRQLDAMEADALAAFLRGEIFSAVCERLSMRLDEELVPMRAAQFLRQWLDEGLIVGLDIK